MEFVDILGYFTGALTCLTFVPQIIKTWEEKTAKDVSLNMFLIAAANEVLWIVYGALKGDWVIILTNIVMLTFALTMIFFKFKYK